MTENEFQEKMNLLNQWLMSDKQGDIALADKVLAEMLGEDGESQNDCPTGSGPTATVEGQGI